MYHATNAAVLVGNATEERYLGPGWSRKYIHQEYPKAKHHWNGQTATVHNIEEEAALSGGWADRTDEFDTYKNARKVRAERRDPFKWLEQWSLPGLTPEHRQRIKAQLLRADSAFERSLESDPDAAALVSMRQAFDGVAGVFFDARMLTEDLLLLEIPRFVWDTAIAAGWWRFASETPRNIFPERLGQYWVWRDKSCRDWDALFRAEAAEWEAKLLEDPPGGKPVAQSPIKQPDPQAVCSPGNESKPPATPADKGRDFSTAVQRVAALEAYTSGWRCSEAALARTARVNPADLSKWKKGSLPAASDKKARIEKALNSREAPTLSVRDRRKA
jgi:hypothetical protein